MDLAPAARAQSGSRLRDPPRDSVTSAGMAKFSTAQKRPSRARQTHHRSAGEIVRESAQPHTRLPRRP